MRCATLGFGVEPRCGSSQSHRLGAFVDLDEVVERVSAIAGELKGTVRNHLLVVDRQPQFILAMEVSQRVAAFLSRRRRLHDEIGEAAGVLLQGHRDRLKEGSVEQHGVRAVEPQVCGTS